MNKPYNYFSILVATVVLLLIASRSDAQAIHLTNAHYLAATTEELFDEGMELVASGDKEALESFV